MYELRGLQDHVRFLAQLCIAFSTWIHEPHARELSAIRLCNRNENGLRCEQLAKGALTLPHCRNWSRVWCMFKEEYLGSMQRPSGSFEVIRHVYRLLKAVEGYL